MIDNVLKNKNKTINIVQNIKAFATFPHLRTLYIYEKKQKLHKCAPVNVGLCLYMYRACIISEIFGMFLSHTSWRSIYMFLEYALDLISAESVKNLFLLFQQTER